MRTTKEFAPITIYIETEDELKAFKRVAREFISYNETWALPHVNWKADKYNSYDLAKKILDL